MKRKSTTIDSKIVDFNVEPATVAVENLTGLKFEDIERGTALGGSTYEIKNPNNQHGTFITINNIEHDGLLYPYELFIHSKNTEHMQWVTVLTCLLSVLFKHEKNLEYIIKEMLEIQDPKHGGYFIKGGGRVSSDVAHIGMIIQTHKENLDKFNVEALECS